MAVYRTGPRSCYVTAGERPTHGYPDGSTLLDGLLDREYQLIDVSGFRYWLPKTLFYNNPVNEVTGRWDGVAGSGLFSNPTQYGTVSPYFFVGSGATARMSTRFLTANTINTVAGMRIPQPITRRATNPIMMSKVAAGNSTITRHFHGLASYTTQIPASSTNPFGNGDSGVMMGFLENPSTNLLVFYNDGTGAPPTPIDTGLAQNTNPRTFVLEFIDSVPKVVWYIMDPTTHAIAATGEITTRIPAQATNLSPHWHVECSTATGINLYLLAAEIRQKS